MCVYIYISISYTQYDAYLYGVLIRILCAVNTAQAKPAYVHSSDVPEL